MINQKTMTPSTIQANESMELFKQGVDNLLSKRSYFISQVLPKLKEGKDYYVIRGKKSLAKGGAEKLASIYSLTAIFERDNESLEMLGNVKGLIAFVCTLTKFGVVVGQGRGPDTMERNNNDPNKTLKMTQKRAFVDAVIRSTGLSDIFTQDLEDMHEKEIVAVPETYEKDKYKEWISDLVEETDRSVACKDIPPGNLITEKQKKLLTSLILQKIYDEDDREERLRAIESYNKFDASEAIKELINGDY
jgi:hypothetical protein